MLSLYEMEELLREKGLPMIIATDDLEIEL